MYDENFGLVEFQLTSMVSSSSVSTNDLRSVSKSKSKINYDKIGKRGSEVNEYKDDKRGKIRVPVALAPAKLQGSLQERYIVLTF